MAVAHDEFRGMGLSGVSGFLGVGAVVVDVREMIEGGLRRLIEKHPINICSHLTTWSW